MNISAIFIAHNRDTTETESACSVHTDSGLIELMTEPEAGIVSATLKRNGKEFDVTVTESAFHVTNLGAFRDAFVPKGPRL